MSDEVQQAFKTVVSLSNSKRDATGLVLEYNEVTLKGQESTKELLKLAQTEMRSREKEKKK